MSQSQIYAAAQRAYEASDSKYHLSFERWLLIMQHNGFYWGIPQEGED